MPELTARNVGPSGIDIAYERFGDPGAPPVLLIMGAGAQLINWPEGFCQELVDRGLHVIRFDSRDAGRSTHFPEAPVPDFPAALAGDFSSASYTLSDLAADTIGLLDALGLTGAHLVGSSMGGMIAQVIAIEYPDRVRSLTSMMSTTGQPGVGEADFSMFADLGAPPRDREAFIDWQVRALRLAASPVFPFDETAAAERSGRVFDRGYDPLASNARASRYWPPATAPNACGPCGCPPWSCTAPPTSSATSAAATPRRRPSPTRSC